MFKFARPLVGLNKPSEKKVGVIAWSVIEVSGVAMISHLEGGGIAEVWGRIPAGGNWGSKCLSPSRRR